jgi:hypothetical protein
MITIGENMTKHDDLMKLLVSLITGEDLKDSIEFGTPSKGGAVKIYCDFSDLPACKAKIDAAQEARKHATDPLMEKNGGNAV